MHKILLHTVCNTSLVLPTSCDKNGASSAVGGVCEKETEGQCVSYLAFVKVVDDFLVELLFQLSLRCRLEPVPLSEVGCTHVL